MKHVTSFLKYSAVLLPLPYISCFIIGVGPSALFVLRALRSLEASWCPTSSLDIQTHRFIRDWMGTVL